MPDLGFGVLERDVTEFAARYKPICECRSVDDVEGVAQRLVKFSPLSFIESANRRAVEGCQWDGDEVVAVDHALFEQPLLDVDCYF